MNPNRLLITIASISFSAIVIALYLQHYLNMQPCPYCIIQRYLFIALGIFCIISAKSNQKSIPIIISLITSLSGLLVAAKHVYILAYPGLSCGIDPVETVLNKMVMATYLPNVFKADGLCSDATEIILGLSIPQWSLFTFALLSLALMKILITRKNKIN